MDTLCLLLAHATRGQSLVFFCLAAITCSLVMWPTPAQSAVNSPPWMTPLHITTAAVYGGATWGSVPHKIHPDLPRPLQTSRRMLVMINAYHFNASASHIPNTLETLTTLCERGEEVHVSLHTASPALAPYVFAPTQRFFCQRLGASLPVIVYQYAPDIALRIAGVHRELVAAKINVYDWFMYAEDDLALRAHNIDYLQRWTPRLAAGGMLPHLMRYEVASLAEVSATSGAVPPPHRDAMLLDEYPFPVKLSSMHRRQVTLVQVANPYMAMWCLPRDLLLPVVSRPAWLDEVRRHADRNLRVYFATSWLLPHYKFAVPLHHFRDALVHHVSTHYSDIGLQHAARQRSNASHPLFLHHFFSQDAWDLEGWLRSCLGLAVVGEPPYYAHVEVDMAGQCLACLRRGKRVSFDVRTRREGLPMELTVACE